MERNVIFSRCDEPGLEHLRLVEQHGEILVDSLLIAIENDIPFRTHSLIRCDNAWHVQAVSLELLDNQSRKLHLQTAGKGHWSTIGFTAELEVDNEGLILNYPNLWKRARYK